MTTILLASLLAVFQQPTTAQQPQQSRPAPSQVAQPAKAVPKTAFDTTVAAMVDVGTKVAEMRSAYELYRRAAFNSPDGAILDRANLYRSSCRALAQSVRDAERSMCRTCLAANMRPAIEAYRANLPSVSRMGDQCAARVTQLRNRGDDAAAAAAMRADIRAEGERIVNELRPYEARVAEVRRVMGWDTPVVAPTPRRGS